MIGAQTPDAAPQDAQDEPQPEPGTSNAIGVSDAWKAVIAAVERVEPQDDLSRAVGAAARATLRAEAARAAEPPNVIPAEWAQAVAFMRGLAAILDRMDADRNRNAAAVFEMLFARHAPPGPNGTFR